MATARGRWSTIPEAPSLATSRRGRALRRVYMAAIVLLLIAALGGLLGVRTVERTAAGEGYQLTVRYAAVARPGLAAPWSLDIVREGGFTEGETVRVRLESAYFDMFDENGFDPDPESSTSDGDFMIQEFSAPDGDTLGLSFDARIEPGVQWGKRGRAAVLDDDGSVLAEVRFHTRVLP